MVALICHCLFPTANIFLDNIDYISLSFQKFRTFSLSHFLLFLFYDPFPESDGSVISQHLESQYPCPLCNFVAFESTALEDHFAHSHAENNDNALHERFNNSNINNSHESNKRGDCNNTTNFSANGTHSTNHSNSGELGSEVSHYASYFFFPFSSEPFKYSTSYSSH